MNVYLDIDGVLLANEENLAIGAVEFIKYAVEHCQPPLLANTLSRLSEAA